MAPVADKDKDFKSDCGRTLTADSFKSAPVHNARLDTDRSSLFDLITVKVGKESICFPVLESVVCKSSKFFDNAMKSEWAATRTDPRTMDLTGEKPEVFTVYIHFLLQNTLNG
jgi:hypothetical protein